MPLSHGKSKEAFSKNVSTEMHAGKPMKQSLAIAYAMKRRKKMAMGGQLASGYLGMPYEPVMKNKAALEEDDKDLNQEGEEDEGPMGAYAQGGMTMRDKMNRGEVDTDYGPNPEHHEDEDKGPSFKDLPFNDQMMVRMHENTKNSYGSSEPEEGDEYPSVEESAYAYGGDIVDHIMRKRYSEGGKVANATPIVAGFKPNEFDDLVLRDDLESTYGHDDNAGDALGNAQEDEDRHDIIARIMKQRKMKQHNPRPA